MFWGLLFLSLITSSAQAAKSCDARQAMVSMFERKSDQRYLRRLSKSSDLETKVFFEMSNYSGNRHLTEVELKKISSIFENEALTKNGQASAAFDVYFKARLKDLDPEEQEILKRLVHYRNDHPSFYGVNGSVNVQTGDIHRTMPSDYFDTILGYSLLVHEMEHSVQWIKYARLHPNEFNKVSLLPFFNRNFGRSRFLSEFGAMKVEAEFVNAIPLTEKLAFLEKVKEEQNPDLEKLTRFFFGEPDTSVEGYVSRQWKLGRNTKLKYIKKNAAVVALGNAPAILIGGTIYGVQKYARKWYCEQQKTLSLEERSLSSEKFLCD